MATAPEPYLSACLRVLYRVTIQCRMWCWAKEVSPAQIADLMDAVHNIPELIQHWERCDVDLLRRTLQHYDNHWGDIGDFHLCPIFDHAVAHPRP